MNEEMKRLIESELSEVERSILSSASLDRPSPEGMARSATALGLSAAVETAKVATVVKWGVAVGVTALLGFGTLRLRESGSEPRKLAPAVAVVEKVGEEAKRNEEVREPVAAPTEPVADEAPAPKAVTRVAPPSGVRPTSIAEEIAAMDGARRLFSSGQYRAALDALAAYKKRFPRPTFAQESALLRIEALAKTGATAQARTEARGFLQRYPKSPHTSKVARLAE
jgi:TolA-binding protein